jgi:GDP-L-fucose synthase
MGVKVTISDKIVKNKINVAVIGSSGFIGSNLASYLASLEDYSVRGSYFTRIDNEASQLVNQTQVDCRDLKGMKDFLYGSEIVVMCAAITSGAKDIAQNPLVHLNQNTIMNSVALQAAYESEVRKFIFISSNTVYPPGNHPMKEGDENDEYYPTYEVVGTMKRNAERMCELYPKLKIRPMDTRIVRPANSYGPNDKFDAEVSHVIPALISRIIKSSTRLEVWGNGQDIKDFIYIKDLVLGIKKVIEYEGENRIFNLVSGQESTIQDVIEILKKLTQKNNLEVLYDTSKPQMIPIRRLSGELAKRELGFKAKTSLEHGLAATLDWYLQKYNARS